MPALRGDSPIQYVKGVGPRRAEWFAEIGIRTVDDLLAYYPFRHELDSGEIAIEDLKPNITATVRGEVVHIGGRRPTLRCEIDDGTGTCILRWFNQQYGVKGLHVGANVVATGRMRLYDGCPELIQPRVQVFDPKAVIMSPGGGSRRVGVYRGNAQIKSPVIRRVVSAVLAAGRLPVEEVIPRSLLDKHALPGREQAVRDMHCPPNDKALTVARRRLAYEEFLLLELAMALRRRNRQALQRGQKLHVTPEVDARIRARFPFQLTPSQDKVVGEIVRDLRSGQPMTRLLQGDVGSGKTVVALYACLAAIANGRQAAIMAPTEILAQQHFRNIEHYLAGSRVRHVMLRGKLGRKQRSETLAAIEAGEVDLVVGTQALIQKDVAFNELAVVVVDEQHKFGVVQRHQFRTKGLMPHYLVMTATPIPRTLAMTVFGDLDASVIEHSPPGRGQIVTKLVTRQQWPTVMKYVRGRLEVGEQAYVVCPVIGKGDDETPEPGDGRPTANAGKSAALMSVAQAHERLTSGPWSGLRVGLLHGSLPQAEKQATIEAFAAGDLHAVVATTVVEVGVDVANATVMVIEHAERYGLSQLHQLRGRVGRGSQDSLCVLIAHGRGEKAVERLSVLARTTDGFEIAEADLRQRGPGQLFGTRQHGLPELQVASIVDDFALLEQARRDAFEIIAHDPNLSGPEHVPLLPALKRMFGEKLALIDAA